MPQSQIKFVFGVISGIYFCQDIVKKVSDIMSSVHLGNMNYVRRNGGFHTFNDGLGTVRGVPGFPSHTSGWEPR